MYNVQLNWSLNTKSSIIFFKIWFLQSALDVCCILTSAATFCSETSRDCAVLHLTAVRVLA